MQVIVMPMRRRVHDLTPCQIRHISTERSIHRSGGVLEEDREDTDGHHRGMQEAPEGVRQCVRRRRSGSRLEAKGWRIGTAKEFLDLSPEEDAYIEIRLRLADGLKERRLRRGVTQTQLAKAVRSSQSRIAKMEAGDPTVSIDLLIRTLLALGATGREVGHLIAKRTRRAA